MTSTIRIFIIYLAHPHRKIHQLRSVLDLPNKPVLYNTPGKVEMIYNKLESFLDQDGIKLSEQDRNVLEQSKKVVLDSNVSIDMGQWSFLMGKMKIQMRTRSSGMDFIFTNQFIIDIMLDKLPLDHQFPLLDIFRTLFATKIASEHYSNDCKLL